jgi:hypothetical protein
MQANDYILTYPATVGWISKTRSVTLVLFDGHRPRLNKRMLVMVVFPMAFAIVPIAVMVVVPIFIIPIVIPSILVSLDW